MIERTTEEVRMKLLSEFSARNYESLHIQSKARSLFMSSASLGLISLFTLFPSYSPRLAGLILTLTTSVTAMIFVFTMYGTIIRSARYLGYALNELAHQINMIDPQRVEVIDQMYSREHDSMFLQVETIWGLFIFHFFCIAIAVLKYFEYLHFGTPTVG